MDLRFIKAFTESGETKLLGYRLRPFSMKHRMALHAIGSPFVTPEKPLTVLDLFVAVKICAEKSVRRLTFMDVCRMSYIEANAGRLEQYVKDFHAYSNVGNWPRFWERGRQQGASKSVPWILAVVSNLIANGWEEEAAWSLPESQAVWYHTAISIRNGNDVALLNDEDEDIMNNFEQFAAEAKAKPRVRRPNKTNA